MGKYTSLKGTLPQGSRSKDTGPFIERVEKIKQEFSSLATADLLAEYRGRRAAKEKTEKDLTEANAYVRAAEELIVERQDLDGLTMYKDTDGNTYYQEVVPQVKVLDPDKAELWVEEKGLDYIWQLGPKLASTIKEMMVSGEAVPDGVFELSAYTKLKMKKGANSGQATNPGVSEEEPF